MANKDLSTGNPSLQAKYASPKDTHQFELQLPHLSQQPSTQEKTAYLSSLRSAVVNLQEQVNVWLTTKMEEDKTLALDGGDKVDEQKEEENYGEEVIEED